MISASKASIAAIIALLILAVAGSALVVGPQAWRDRLGGRPASVAAKSETGAAESKAAETKSGAKVAAATETRGEAKVESNKVESNKADATPAARPAATAKVADASATAAAPVANALAATEKQANAALGDLAPSKPLAAADSRPGSGPSFDVARIDESGEAVIAGRAAPGARVELLRDGMPLDAVVADSGGQFVMTPPTLPGGRYELSLRAKSPDGTVAQSSRTVPVTLAEVSPPRASVAAAVPAAPRLAAAPARTALATAPPAETPTGTLAASRDNRIVVHGDSLWAISRRAYGDGARYSLIFNANRARIHDPDLIYPGQTFVLPRR